MELIMKIEGKVLKKLERASQEIKDIFRGAVLDASTLMMENTIQETPASTGNLRKSIRREISKEGLKASIFPTVVYGAWLHGTFDGSDGEFSVPRMIPAREAQPGGTLYRWAVKKGMNPWAVRGSIATKGVRRNRFLKRAAESSEADIKNIFEKALKQTSTSLSD